MPSLNPYVEATRIINLQEIKETERKVLNVAMGIQFTKLNAEQKHVNHSKDDLQVKVMV